MVRKPKIYKDTTKPYHQWIARVPAGKQWIETRHRTWEEAMCRATTYMPDPVLRTALLPVFGGSACIGYPPLLHNDAVYTGFDGDPYSK